MRAQIPNSIHRPGGRQRPGSKEIRNPRVSTLSRFLDLVWDFTKEITNPAYQPKGKKILWAFEVKEGELFSHRKYASLMHSCKQLMYAMLWNPEQNRRAKPNTAIHHWLFIRHFVIYLANRKYPILRFKDVTPFVVDEYVKSLEGQDGRGKKRSKRARYPYHYCLKLLYIYRQKVTDSLTFDPFGGESPGKGLGVIRDRGAKTPHIPDDILTKLVTAALDYVDRHSEFLIEAATVIERIVKKYGGRDERLIESHVQRQLSELVSRRAAGGKITSDLGELKRTTIAGHLIRLRTSCYILVAFVTGMRVSEILSLKEGCVETEYTEDGEFVWVNSTLHKTLGGDPSAPDRWLCGPVAARAIAALEWLTAVVRSRASHRKLFVPVTRWGLSHWMSETISATAMNDSLMGFVEWLDLRDEKGNLFRLHTHMFRPTFARHVVRNDTTNLLALKDHFKHVSLAMTDQYVGVDEELQDLLNDEANRLSFESFDKALRSDRLGGPRGKDLVKQVDAAIADGRLPPEFRGEAGAHLRRKMIAEWVEAGQQIYPCGLGNDCWFRAGYALCTQGDRPVVEICNSSCPNCVIRPEHGPYWESIETRAEELLRLNPKGEPYKQRLYNIVRIARKVRQDIS